MRHRCQDILRAAYAENRDEYASACRKVFEKLIEHVKLITVSREELNKKLAKETRDFVFKILTVIAGATIAVSAILNLLFCK
jgi:hypothetical protein